MSMKRNYNGDKPYIMNRVSCCLVSKEWARAYIRGEGLRPVRAVGKYWPFTVDIVRGMGVMAKI